MRRLLFVIIAVALAIGVFAVGMMIASQTPTPTPTPVDLPTQTPDTRRFLTATPTPSETPASTTTEEACTVLDMEAAPDLRMALAVDAMYEEMPLFKTPVAIVVTEAKPLSVGCLEAGD